LVRGGGDEALFLQTLHENRFTRGYSWAERSSVLHRLVTLWEMDRPRVVQEAMPALGLAPSPKLLEEHLRAAILAEPVRRALIRNECSLANALRLARWRTEDQMALVPVLDGLHWGESLLRECLGLMWEIGMREGITAWAFLEDPEIAGIMTDPERDPPERTAAFRAILRRRRYPTLVAMEEGFRVAHSRLRLPSGVSLQPIPFFEERGVRVAFRARAPEEFKEFCRKLWCSCEEGSRVDDLFRSTDGPVE